MGKKHCYVYQIYHTYAAVKHKKADLSLERSAEINLEFIKFVKKNINRLPLTKDGEY